MKHKHTIQNLLTDINGDKANKILLLEKVKKYSKNP